MLDFPVLPNSEKTNYRRRLPHIQKDDRPVFVTAVTSRRWEIPEALRLGVLESCMRAHRKLCVLHVAVVMPDHVHLILTPGVLSSGVVALPQIMQAIKGSAARHLNKALNRHGPVWQEESFDHVLRSNESLDEKVQYVLMNPVRAGLASRPEDYPWSWIGEIPTI